VSIAEKKDAQPALSKRPPEAMPDPSSSRRISLHASQFLAILVGSFTGGAIVIAALLFSEMLVPARVASQLMSEIEGLKRQNNALRSARERSDLMSKELERRLAGTTPEEMRSRMSEMQTKIDGLERQIDTMRASEWPPLAAAAQEALYRELQDMPAREVWVGYADSGGRALAKTFSEVFKRLNWPQKYDILAVVDPQEGLWITPISDFSEQVRDRVQRSTGLDFKLFPHREQLPDEKQMGIIIGYRTANDGDVP
jgi:hypothetical protein